MHFAATIERAEKQIILARHGRSLLNLLDDTPVVPGDARPSFEHAERARQVLVEAEEDLRSWQPNLEPISTSAGAIGANLMPSSTGTGAPSSVGAPEPPVHGNAPSEIPPQQMVTAQDHFQRTHLLDTDTDTNTKREASGSTAVEQAPYDGSEAGQSTVSYQ